MKIHIREHNVEVTPKLRAHVVRRLDFVLGRFRDRIGRVFVQFSDTHLSGAELRCRVDVSLRPQSVRIEDSDPEAFAAANHAIARTERIVRRALERERVWDPRLTPSWSHRP
jgi:ribosomal subunit interface protein